MTPHDPTPLTGRQRSYLRALAHPLKPLIQIGHGGLTDAVLRAIDNALLTHELIKIRVSGNDELSISELAPEVEERTRSSVAQVIGKTLIVYRRRNEQPRIVLPRADGTPGKIAKPAKSAKTSKGVKPPKGVKPSKAVKPAAPKAGTPPGKAREFVKPSRFGKRG